MKVSLIAFIALLGNVSAAEQASSVASLASNKKERKLNGYYPVHSPTYHYPYFSTPYPTHRPPTPYPTGRAPTERPTPNPTPYPTPHPTPFVHAPTYPEPDHNNGYHPHPDHYPDDNHHDPNPQTRQTPHPTHHPTHRQTPYPTPRPTSRPTPHPTMRPTSDPTPYPTPEPTREPSPGPSPAPSPEPSAYPSAHPSLAPSSLPSAKPSSAPSKTPSDYPSLSPAPSSLEPTQSDEPSENPTQSEEPSENPTQSEEPSENPTESEEPSENPTESVEPTEVPTTGIAPLPTLPPILSPTPGLPTILQDLDDIICNPANDQVLGVFCILLRLFPDIIAALGGPVNAPSMELGNAQLLMLPFLIPGRKLQAQGDQTSLVATALDFEHKRQINVGSLNNLILQGVGVNRGTATSLINPPITVFAPTNAAFIRMSGNGILSFLTEGNREALKDILLFHMFNQEVHFGHLVCTDIIEMLNGDKTTTRCKNGFKFQVGVGSATNAEPKIVVADQEASNGVLHVVDEVIMPPISTMAPSLDPPTSAPS
mmetsp:Transcript_6771/g.14420  ORF Transcript_6771/g.14420 Transcript_6771/m.14420 type:complete len:539 (-) Transcript_6771:578-2194(-)